jgi:protein involved in polysaccharide export with SLBB domain
VIHRLLAVAFLIGASSAAPSARAQSSAVRPGQIVLRPGDVVRVAVWQRPEYSGEFFVAADSTLKHPLFQGVKVGGIPMAMAGDRMREFLSEFISNPQVSLEPLFHLSVLGEVRQPNLYRLPPETNLSQALALAGGPTERGRVDRVLLVRGGQETLLDLTQPGASAAHMSILSGDQLIVTRRRDLFRELIIPLATLAGAAASIAALISK